MFLIEFGIPMQLSPESKSSSSQSTSGALGSDSSDSDREEGCTGSPRMQRRRKRRNKSRSSVTYNERQSGPSSGEADSEDLAYVDTLPEVNYFMPLDLEVAFRVLSHIIKENNHINF